MTIPMLLLIAVTSLPPLPWQTPTPIDPPKGKEQRIPMRVQGSQAAAVRVTPWVTTGFSITNVSVNIMSGTVSLGWNGGVAPYQIWQSPTLTGPWSTAGNTLLYRAKTVPLEESQFWKLQAQAPSQLTANPTNQPRLSWTTPDQSVSDSLTPFIIEKSTDGGTNWSAIAASDAGLAAGHFNTTTRSANDATTPPVRYRMTEVTANGVTVPYNSPSLSNNVSGAVIRAVGYNSTLNCVGKVIKVLPDRSYIIAGYFKGTANFGGLDLTSAPGWSSLFIAKYSTGGSHVWSKSYGGAGDITANGIDMDSSGNVYLCGLFTGTGNFGGASFPVLSSGAWHAKYDTSGNHLWSHGYTTGDISRFCTFSGCVVDSNNNVFEIGYFMGNGTSFGGAPIVVQQQFEQSVLAKYDKDGNFLWNITFPAPLFGPYNHGLSIAKDTSDNVYIGGTFYYSVDLAFNNPGNDGSHTIYSSSTTYKQAYVGKFDNNGIHQWSFRRGGDTPNTTPGPPTQAGNHPSSQTTGLALDTFGNLYGAFDITGSTDLGAGVNMPAGTLGGTGVARYRASDGVYVGGSSWQQQYILTGDSMGVTGLACDITGNPVVCLFFQGSTSGGVLLPDGTNLTCAAYDGLVSKLNSGSGSMAWYNQVKGPRSEGVGSNSTDPVSGNTLTLGNYNDTTVFGRPTQSMSLTAPNSFANAFVIEITP